MLVLGAVCVNDVVGFVVVDELREVLVYFCIGDSVFRLIYKEVSCGC